MPIAALVLDFDPYLRLDDRAIRWETLALAGAILVALVLAALIAGRTPADSVLSARRTPAGADHLRRDDLLFIVLGIVPGAVLGGRLGYVLLHLDYYTVRPEAIVDPGQGSLELSLAVVVGALTGAYVARLLEAPVGHWAHVAAVPLLVALALGKAAMALGGSGQGAPWDGSWATAYAGPGPWGSLDPATPAWPSQLLEAGLTLAALLVLLLVLVARRPRRRQAPGGLARGTPDAVGHGAPDAVTRAGPDAVAHAAPDTVVHAAPDGRVFLLAVGLWAIVRFAVAFTWRDPLVLGPLRAEQVIAALIAAGCLVALGLATRHARRAAAEAARAAEAADRSRLTWPEPSEGFEPGRRR